ncbi:MAG: hypothetical protein LC118_20295 [Dehalococcoidia bacterium]|nr:hypothetical protein [Dehalococcoidia bacterium]
MSTPVAVFRDERTSAVENASFRWAFLAMSFALLGSIAFRALVFRQSNWDLMAIVILGGGISYAYQGLHRAITKRWFAVSALAVLVAAVISILTVVSLR